jgi:2C-methyl-D-erythritol 2,4-cyclodiphosphate synthase
VLEWTNNSTERLGYLGRGEGIAAEAVALLEIPDA